MIGRKISRRLLDKQRKVINLSKHQLVKIKNLTFDLQASGSFYRQRTNEFREPQMLFFRESLANKFIKNYRKINLFYLLYASG